MIDKLKVVGWGALEAFGAGALVGLATVWMEPADVILTLAGIKAAAVIAVKFGIIYLFAFMWQNRNF
jgi:hypothetical protein